MTLTGAVDKLNLALDGMQYTAPKDFVGTTTLTVIADDLGTTEKVTHSKLLALLQLP